MNSVKISGLVLTGVFTLGFTSGNIVSAAEGAEVVSGIVGEGEFQGDELTKLNNGKGSVNDVDNSDAKTDASEDPNANKENVEGNLANGDDESSEKKKSDKVSTARVVAYAVGGAGTTGALGMGAKFAYDEFAKAGKVRKINRVQGKRKKGRIRILSRIIITIQNLILRE